MESLKSVLRMEAYSKGIPTAVIISSMLYDSVLSPLPRNMLLMTPLLLATSCFKYSMVLLSRIIAVCMAYLIIISQGQWLIMGVQLIAGVNKFETYKHI